MFPPPSTCNDGGGESNNKYEVVQTFFRRKHQFEIKDRDEGIWNGRIRFLLDYL